MALGPEVTVLQLISYVKKIMKINGNLSIFIKVGGTVPSMSTTVGDLSERFTSVDDGFLYLTVKTEDSFWFAHFLIVLLGSFHHIIFLFL